MKLKMLVLKNFIGLFLAVIVILLTSACSDREITVDFVSNDGNDMKTYVFTRDDFSLPIEPKRDGFIFDGWYLDKNTFQEPFSEETILEDETVSYYAVYAKWIDENSFVIPDLQSVYDLAIISNQFSGDYEAWIESSKGNHGGIGSRYINVNFIIEDEYLKWKFEDEETWTELLKLSNLKNDQEQHIIFKIFTGVIHWKVEVEDTWHVLIDLKTMTGTIDKSLIFYVYEGKVLYKIEGPNDYQDLVDLKTLTGVSASEANLIEFEMFDHLLLWKFISHETWDELVDLRTLNYIDGEDKLKYLDVTELARIQLMMMGKEFKWLVTWSKNSYYIDYRVSDEVKEETIQTYLITAVGDDQYFLVVGDDGTYVEIINLFPVDTDPLVAIQEFINLNYGDYEVLNINGPLMDEEIRTNAYIQSLYDYQSVLEIAEAYQISVNDIQIYETVFSTWTDAVIVIKINEYYYGFYWL